MTARSLLLCFIAASLAAPASVAREDDGPKAAPQDQRAESKRYYELGRASFDLARWEQSLEAFELSYDVQPHPILLFNIGQCHRKLGRHAEAIERFERYLQELPDASNRSDVEELLSEERKLLSMTPEPGPEPEPEPAAEVAPTPVDPSVASASVEDPSMLETWWFWTAVGGAAVAVAAVGGTAAAVAVASQPAPVEDAPSAGRFDLRGQTP